jgi:hypothetical protein
VGLASSAARLITYLAIKQVNNNTAIEEGQEPELSGIPEKSRDLFKIQVQFLGYSI